MAPNATDSSARWQAVELKSHISEHPIASEDPKRRPLNAYSPISDSRDLPKAARKKSEAALTGTKFAIISVILFRSVMRVVAIGLLLARIKETMGPAIFN